MALNTILKCWSIPFIIIYLCHSHNYFWWCWVLLLLSFWFLVGFLNWLIYTLVAIRACKKITIPVLFMSFLKKIKVKSHVKNLIGKEKSMKFQHEHETKPKLPLYFFLFSIFPPYFDL